MQIDVNSVADRVQLIRTQLTAAKGPQFKAKPVGDNAVSVLAGKAPSAVEKIPGIRTTRAISAAVPPGPPASLTVRPDASVNTPQTPVPTPKPVSDLDALLADWGQTDSPYDLDGNGIVGASDLLLLLARMSGGSQQPQEPHVDLADPTRPSVTVADQPRLGDTSTQIAEPVSDLDALLADWGQTDSPYDLDGNGIVGASDLLLLLAKMSGGSEQPQGPHGDVPADPNRPSITVADQPPLSDTSTQITEPVSDLDALLADWGKTDSPYDLDGNGFVGASDLLMLLAKLGGEGSQQPKEPDSEAARPRRLSPRVAVETAAPPNIPHNPPIIPSKAGAIGVKTTAIAQDVIDKLDQDNNGTITRSEVEGSTQAFDRLDRNHDGALSRSELASQIRNMLLDHLAKSPSANLDRFVREAMNLLSDHDEADEAPSKRNSAVERSSSVYRQANLKATTRQLVQGLTDQGAMELRKFVQAGELSANEKRTVLDQISRLRPGAQRVNLVG